MRTGFRSLSGLVLLALIACCSAGCASVGPQTVVRDRFDYVSSISDSAKQQMLLNLLKVRYADAPVFMDVASVISSYSLEGDLTIGGQIAPQGRSGDTFGGGTVNTHYADKPTITYQPVAGDKFARSLMAPIPVSGILSLIQSGYPADTVLRLCVNRINGLDNAYGGPGNPRAGDPRFHQLMLAMRASQQAGVSGFRVKSSKEGQAIVMFIHAPSSPDDGVAAQKVHDLLGLSKSEREFTVVPAGVAENDREVAMQTRSMLQMMIDYASYIDVPDSDVAEGRVFRTERSEETLRMFPPVLRVSQGTARPQDAYVSVKYRDRWFWIDDRDRISKQMLTFLMMSFTLTEGASTTAAPVVTIPAR